MESALEIAVALESRCLTFFIGTGLSKYLTDGAAPSWLQLLEQCARELDPDPKGLLAQVFELDIAGRATRCRFDLLVAAQILNVAYQQANQDLKSAAADIVRKATAPAKLNADKVAQLKAFFATYRDVTIVTTNYDSLLSEQVLPGSRTFIEGTPPRHMNQGKNVFHIHGSVKNPSSLVLTIEDYYQFLHRENYFSRKLYTLLQETTVVILGYSLGDFNVNSVLNEVKAGRRTGLRRSDVYYITRTPVDPLVDQFYRFTYGIEVIGSVEVGAFTASVAVQRGNAAAIIQQTQDLADVVAGTKAYTDAYLKLSSALEHILLQAAALGYSDASADLGRLVVGVLQKKESFTYEAGAWDQYTHLADWLIVAGARLGLGREEPEAILFLDVLFIAKVLSVDQQTQPPGDAV